MLSFLSLAYTVENDLESGSANHVLLDIELGNTELPSSLKKGLSNKLL